MAKQAKKTGAAEKKLPGVLQKLSGRNKEKTEEPAPHQTPLRLNANERSGIFAWFLFAFLFLSLYLLGILAWPFIHTIILACIFSALTYPLYSKVRNKIGGGGVLASLLTLLFLVIIIAFPLVFFSFSLVEQASKSISSVMSWLSGTHLDVFINEEIAPVLGWMHERFGIEIVPAQVRANLLKFASETGQALLGWGTNLLSDTFTFVSSLVLLLLIMFFLLKDGREMLGGLKKLLPMREEQKNHILGELRSMSKAVLVGGLSVAAVQGIVGGIGLAVVGIPAIFWGTLMAFAALVPVVGTALVWGPAAAYLFIMGDWPWGVFLLVWCGGIVTSIDSFLRPVLMRGSSNLSVLFLFMSVFGGIRAFGMFGLIYGPLILSFAAVMLRIYAEEYSEALYSGQQSKSGNDCAGPQ